MDIRLTPPPSYHLLQFIFPSPSLLQFNDPSLHCYYVIAISLFSGIHNYVFDYGNVDDGNVDDGNGGDDHGNGGDYDGNGAIMIGDYDGGDDHGNGGDYDGNGGDYDR